MQSIYPTSAAAGPTPTPGEIEQVLARTLTEPKDIVDGAPAREALDWSLSIYTRTLGPDHPTTGPWPATGRRWGRWRASIATGLR